METKGEEIRKLMQGDTDTSASNMRYVRYIRQGLFSWCGRMMRLNWNDNNEIGNGDKLCANE